MSLLRHQTAVEPGADIRFALARERLAAEDEERRAWLDRVARIPDADEFAPHPENKKNPAPSRCMRWGCHRKVRSGGLCATHYTIDRRAARREGRTNYVECACGCGELVVRPAGVKGAPPKYASDACRRKVWDRFKPKSNRGYGKARAA